MVSPNPPHVHHSLPRNRKIAAPPRPPSPHQAGQLPPAHSLAHKHNQVHETRSTNQPTYCAFLVDAPVLALCLCSTLPTPRRPTLHAILMSGGWCLSPPHPCNVPHLLLRTPLSLCLNLLDPWLPRFVATVSGHCLCPPTPLCSLHPASPQKALSPSPPQKALSPSSPKSHCPPPPNPPPSLAISLTSAVVPCR